MNEIVWWSEGPSLPMQQLGWMALALATVMAVGLAITYYRALARRMQPLWIYRRIAIDLGLSGAQQWRLYRVARQQHLTSPLTLLLSPATFTHHTTAYIAQLTTKKLPTRSTELHTLRDRLFGETPEHVEK